MSCPNATAPVDIVNDPSQICDLKCEYSFSYQNTNLNVTNSGDHLKLIPTDKSNNPPVTYNSDKYECTEMRIYRPSLHSYRGKKADAEIVIIHSNVSGSSGDLLVCVPIMNNGSRGNSVSIFDKIISSVASTANSAGSQTTVNIPTFSIDKLIPAKPYFSYSGTLPYSPCNNYNSDSEYDYIVFSLDNDAALSISKQALDALKVVITKTATTTHKNDGGVFFNKKGPTPLTGKGMGDDIFIECNPTDNDGHVLVPLEKNSSQSFNASSFFSSGIIKFLHVIIAIIVCFILYYVLKFTLSKFAGSKRGGSTSTTSSTGSSSYLDVNPL